MPVNYPKFDKKIQDQIDLASIRSSKTRPGTIAGYDKTNNVATIMLDEQFSDSIGNVIRGVPCPLIRGVQTVAPVMGARCLVGFRDNNESNPYVINFFDDTVSAENNKHQYIVRTGIPRFMVH